MVGGCSGDPSTLRPGGGEQEGAVVGVLVQIGVGAPGLWGLGGRVRIQSGGQLGQLVPELLDLLGQTVHRVGVVGGDGVGKGLGREDSRVSRSSDLDHLIVLKVLKTPPEFLPKWWMS